MWKEISLKALNTLMGYTFILMIMEFKLKECITDGCSAIIKILISLRCVLVIQFVKVGIGLHYFDSRVKETKNH